MKVPQINPLQVAPGQAQLPARAVTQPRGLDLSQASAGLDQAGSAAFAEYEKQKQAAEAKKVTDAVTEYQRAETDADFGSTVTPTDPNAAVPDVTKMSEQEFGTFLEGPKTQQIPGFLSTKGEGALASVDERDKKLEEARQKIGAKLQTKLQKERYLEETGRLYEGSKRRARGHVAQELERAKEDSLKAGLAETLRAAAKNPLDEEAAVAAVAGLAGRAAAMATSKEDADNKVEAIRGEVAKTRAQALILSEKYDAAQLVVNGSRKALGQTANLLDDKIKDGLEVAGVQSAAAAIASTSHSDNVFNPMDLNAVEKKLSEVPEEKRKKVRQAVDELVGADARRVRADKERFIDAAQTQFIEQRGAFFTSTTAKVLQVVDPPTYFALEDRLKSANRAARAEGRERETLQSSLDKMALDDLKTRLDGADDPGQFNMQSFFNSHPELSGRRVNEANAIKAARVKTYEKGLKPNQDAFAAGFVAEASNKMPTFEGTPQQVRDQRTAWKTERRNQAVEMFQDAMGPEGEKPDQKALTEARARAILDLPLAEVNERTLGANTKAIGTLARPPPPPPSTETITATGKTVAMPNGDVYAVMSDNSVRLLTKAKPKKKK